MHLICIFILQRNLLRLIINPRLLKIFQRSVGIRLPKLFYLIYLLSAYLPRPQLLLFRWNLKYLKLQVISIVLLTNIPISEDLAFVKIQVHKSIQINLDKPLQETPIINKGTPLTQIPIHVLQCVNIKARLPAK